MRKTVYLLNIDGYAPEITELTYPLLYAYADKCGARVHEIRERRFPGWPSVYEKLQIGDLARERRDDWAIYIDSDTLVHPETIDFTDHIGRGTVMHNGCDYAPIRWRYDDYFRRDGRHIGSCNWLAIASSWCLDLWTPLDISLEEALANIRPTMDEQNSGLIEAEHLIDDYTLSRNIARYGLKFKTVRDLCIDLGLNRVNAAGEYEGAWFFWHRYTIPIDEKVAEMRKILKQWQLPVADGGATRPAETACV